MNQGYRQDWTIRGVDHHPFHLHETPVRIDNPLPKCLVDDQSSVYSNLYQEGDWVDSLFIPMCQCETFDCEEVSC